MYGKLNNKINYSINLSVHCNDRMQSTNFILLYHLKVNNLSSNIKFMLCSLISNQILLKFQLIMKYHSLKNTITRDKRLCLKPALVKDTDYTVEKTYLIAPYWGTFGAYLMPRSLPQCLFRCGTSYNNIRASLTLEIPLTPISAPATSNRFRTKLVFCQCLVYTERPHSDLCSPDPR